MKFVEIANQKAVCSPEPNLLPHREPKLTVWQQAQAHPPLLPCGSAMIPCLSRLLIGRTGSVEAPPGDGLEVEYRH